MNTRRRSTFKEQPENQALPEDYPNLEQTMRAPIGGFDGGTRSMLREPSVYVSMAVVLTVATVSMSKTPAMFWASLVAMSVITFAFHLLAERSLLKRQNEIENVETPLDGVFVITLGGVVPVLALVSYGIYASCTSFTGNAFESIGKIGLLLAVPLFNTIVWTAARKGYLSRPRLIGLLNGLSLGFAGSWTLVFCKAPFLSAHTIPCKFGWMLLLCLSPLLLFSAVCLSLDLWRKTEPSIRRITSTFSLLGVLLSLVFTFTPVVKSFLFESLLNDARSSNRDVQSLAVSKLRTTTTPEELRAASEPVTGFGLASLMLPNRGLDELTAIDRDLYFKITGMPYVHTRSNESQLLNPRIGAKLDGLSLAKSQITGSVDPASLSSSIDWTLTLHNISTTPQEAVGEMLLPKGAVVSRVTLWINGQAKEAAFGATGVTTAAYQAVTETKRDPLLVTSTGKDRILIRCSPVPASGGNMKIRIGFKVPLEMVGRSKCTLTLPALVGSNFEEANKHRIHLVSHGVPSIELPGIGTQRTVDAYTLSGAIKNSKADAALRTIVLQRSNPAQEIVTPDWYNSKQSIVQKVNEVAVPAPKRLLVVIDGSYSLKAHVDELQLALSNIPPSIKTNVYLPSENDKDRSLDKPLTAMNIQQARTVLLKRQFVGGEDNGPLLREAIESAGDEPGSAVLWIHGPQPTDQSDSAAKLLDVMHKVSLYDLQIEAGETSILKALQSEDTERRLTVIPVRHVSTVQDIQSLASSWNNPEGAVMVQQSVCKMVPSGVTHRDREISSQLTSLWANGEVARLLALGEGDRALALAVKYRLVTPITGAVVLENAADYEAFKLNPGKFKSRSGEGETYRGMHQWFNDDPVGNLGNQMLGGLTGAPADPRFGQSNEVGQLADYGYDTARDISRIATALAFLIASSISFWFVRSKKSVTKAVVIKAVSLVFLVPMIVHCLGVFMINGCAWLGGGL